LARLDPRTLQEKNSLSSSSSSSSCIHAVQYYPTVDDLCAMIDVFRILQTSKSKNFDVLKNTALADWHFITST